MNNSICSLLSMRIGAQWYGLPTEDIVEVINMVALAELPPIDHVRPFVLGLLTAREKVIPIIDLRCVFGVLDPEYYLNTPIILVQTKMRTLGIVVDEVDNVEQAEVNQINPWNVTEHSFIKGIVKVGERSLLVSNMNLLEYAYDFAP